MNEDKLYRLTRELIDLDSTTENEAEAVGFAAEYLRRSGAFEVELWEVAVPPETAPRAPVPADTKPRPRCNLFARPRRGGRPRVVLSTHLDCVPPFIPSREDATSIHGRGACDAKGICAAQIFAAAELLAAGETDFGLLFVVGEERNSAGALAANLRPQGSRFLINGEPTESRIVTAGKGALRFELHSHGRAAHSAYPELGESATDKLVAAIGRVRALPLPEDPELGPTTINLGTLSGGRAPNVVADEARAEFLARLVEDSASLRARIETAVAGLAEARFVLELPPMKFETVPGFPTTVVAFGTDIPKLDRWGAPVLFGPGSIHVAHTPDEFIAKQELRDAVGHYARIAQYLLKKG